MTFLPGNAAPVSPNGAGQHRVGGKAHLPGHPKGLAVKAPEREVKLPARKSSSSKLVHVNGIDALTGEYLIKPLSIRKLAAAIASPPADPEGDAAAKKRVTDMEDGLMKAVSWVDEANPAEAGWGVVFSGRPEHADEAAQIRKQLEPLLKHRKKQAGALFRVYDGKNGLGDEGGQMWLSRHGVGPGSADPADMPFYLLFAGPPEHIPFEVQYRVDIQRAVGRLCFDDLAGYRRYAEHVVAAETEGPVVERRLELLGPRSRGDAATSLSMSRLIQPLKERLDGALGWAVNATVDKDATTDVFAQVFNRGEAALVMTAGHGIGFPSGHPDQTARQGALLTATWPGVGTPVAGEHTFAGADVASDAALAGRMAFLFACYGGGTPAVDDFAFKIDPANPKQIAEAAFVSALPQRLLAGGMLAVMAHIDRAWSHSFQAPRAGEQVQTFQSTLRALMSGKPVGVAFDDFNVRTGELSFELADLLGRVVTKKADSYAPYAAVWTAATDSRNFVVLGDPAVRLKV